MSCTYYAGDVLHSEQSPEDSASSFYKNAVRAWIVCIILAADRPGFWGALVLVGACANLAVTIYLARLRGVRR